MSHTLSISFNVNPILKREVDVISIFSVVFPSRRHFYSNVFNSEKETQFWSKQSKQSKQLMVRLWTQLKMILWSKQRSFSEVRSLPVNFGKIIVIRKTIRCCTKPSPVASLISTNLYRKVLRTFRYKILPNNFYRYCAISS